MNLYLPKFSQVFFYLPKFRFAFLVWVVLVCVGSTTKAQSGADIYRSALTYSLTALNTSYDGRAAALGGTSSATMADASSPYLNLAKLPFHSRKYGTSISYSPLMFDLVGFTIHAGVIQGFYNFGKANENSVSGGFQFVSFGETDATVNGIKVASYNPSQISGFLGYSRRFGKLAIGASFQFVSQSLVPGNLQVGTTTTSNNTSNLGIAGNLGVFYSSGDREVLMQGEVLRPVFNLGLSLKNIGPKIEYLSVTSFQPANISLGAALVHKAGENFVLQESLEFRKLLVPIFPNATTITKEQVDSYFKQTLFESYSSALTQFQTLSIHAGLEAYIAPARIFARLGATYGNYLFGNDGGITLAAGLGYKYNDFGFHLAYNYTPWSLSNSSIFVTVFWDIGGYLEKEEFETFNLDFFSVEDLFPELE